MKILILFFCLILLVGCSKDDTDEISNCKTIVSITGTIDPEREYTSLYAVRYSDGSYKYFFVGAIDPNNFKAGDEICP